MQISDLIRALSAFDPELPVVVPADGSDGTIDFILVKHVALDLLSHDEANPANLQLSDKRDRNLFAEHVGTDRALTVLSRAMRPADTCQHIPNGLATSDVLGRVKATRSVGVTDCG